MSSCWDWMPYGLKSAIVRHQIIGRLDRVHLDQLRMFWVGLDFLLNIFVVLNICHHVMPPRAHDLPAVDDLHGVDEIECRTVSLQHSHVSEQRCRVFMLDQVVLTASDCCREWAI